MDLILKDNIYKKIKLSLVFFLVGLIACNSEKKDLEIKVNHEANKAVSITIKDELQDFDIHLAGRDSVAVLGNTIQESKTTIFRPIVPFSKGKRYVIKQQGEVMGEFKVENLQNSTIPEVVKIYPSTDTVPQNLLKIYVRFSEPMQAIGKSSDFIKVWDLVNNKEQDIFLELENELWNADRTLLTLWLNPGRIKKDLIPNREEGMPLKNGHSYKLSISDDWKSLEGNNLNRDYEKTFLVSNIDSVKPNVQNWSLSLPVPKTNEPLKIEFNEVLDAQLAMETISIYDREENFVKGKIEIGNKENSMVFVPNNNWELGNYTIKVESRLEDLAGNNLNRLFDSDLHDESVIKETEDYHILKFTIRK